MLQMLEEARIEVERGRLESLAIFSRRTNGSHVQWFTCEPDADICSLYGFALVALQRSVEVKSETEIRPTGSNKGDVQ